MLKYSISGAQRNHHLDLIKKKQSAEMLSCSLESREVYDSSKSIKLSLGETFEHKINAMKDPHLSDALS